MDNEWKPHMTFCSIVILSNAILLLRFFKLHSSNTFFFCCNCFQYGWIWITKKKTMVYWIWGKCIFTNHDFWYRKKHISWDEQTIAEHDKQRGSRMIINEPKTPYNRLGIEESDSLQIKRMIYRS